MSTEDGLRSLVAQHPVLTAMAAGLIAGAVAAGSDKVLDRLVSTKQKRRDRRVREAPAHQMAGPYLASKLLGRRLSAVEKKRASAGFSILYGLGWGIIHGRLAAKFPRLTRWGGLPFAVPFFCACDGVIAPLLGVSPTLRHIPWQPSAKELGNHVAWTAAAELVHRVAGERS
ncbi:DUF1440 domain-containing protein [Geomonas propionica]|uniref:DUF1440 domain-containing protein n=1 Tax=Geomonas propionica TaxID=2798582 RepID=A0ABS0YUM1_9BACT|nr:DUF1440 domain-containing protein [Geomonas propionica]MBJ6801674.1 DUF1440 domain-containing protein [Geomonas propionica]